MDRSTLLRILLSEWFWVPALLALAFTAGILFLALFRPYLDYKISAAQVPAATDPDFPVAVQNATGARAFESTHIEPLRNGETFYAAELEAIAAAKESVHLEAYIFSDGTVAEQFRDAMAASATRGVAVRAILDSIGAMASSESFFKPMTDPGGRIAWYHPAKLYSWDRINNRTHREIIVVDGRIGFTGGAGIAEQWLEPRGGKPAWRDTMFRLEGDAVNGLQSVFAENWLEAVGEILSSSRLYRGEPVAGGSPCLVIAGTPSAGGSTSVRIAIQMSIAAARRRILVTNPYFLPDSGIRRELADAVQRGVEVDVITPGTQSDQMLTSRASRRLYGALLQGGVRIHEYQPTMIHVKTLVVDGAWSVIGTTNFDPRSFGLNDEINVLVPDRRLAERLEEHFAEDLAHSKRVTLEQWRDRPLTERAMESFSWIFERQQ